MMIAAILVFAAVLALFVVCGISVHSALQVSRGADASQQIQSMDLEAFRNLADPAEDDYLRHKLPADDYRRVRRLRLKAMAAYVQIAGKNAGVLIHMGQIALNSADRQTVSAASELINDALLLRRNAAFALLKIYAISVWPSAGFPAAPILDGYRQLSGSAMLLGRLQNPAAPVRIAAS